MYYFSWKEIRKSKKYVGIACAMKNAGVGVGIPDSGIAAIFGAQIVGGVIAAVFLNLVLPHEKPEAKKKQKKDNI